LVYTEAEVRLAVDHVGHSADNTPPTRCVKREQNINSP
jgi:hypothetical protein